uniref:Uncharacterized protein n=1 Tax=Anguilla anguilla TaxID=7936 RepID=A0A0E9X3N4_ANGAN
MHWGRGYVGLDTVLCLLMQSFLYVINFCTLQVFLTLRRPEKQRQSHLSCWGIEIHINSMRVKMIKNKRKQEWAPSACS